MTDHHLPARRDALEQIAAGLAPADNKPDRRQRIAAAFQHDDRMEHLLAMRNSRDPRWADIGAGTQLAAAMYEQHKQTATDPTGDAA